MNTVLVSESALDGLKGVVVKDARSMRAAELVAQFITPREIEIWRGIAEGKVSKQLADELGISLKTVDNHRQHLYSKLEAQNIADLTRLAVRFGIIRVEVLN